MYTSWKKETETETVTEAQDRLAQDTLDKHKDTSAGAKPFQNAIVDWPMVV